MKRKLRELFGIDPRSLALFRVSIALLLLGDLIDRSLSLKAHYTDWGVLPRRELIAYFPTESFYSLHLMSGSTTVQAFLFIIAGAFALMLLAGYRTRAAAIASFVMLFSLQNRNPLVNQSGDTLLRVLLFWGLFLPLGAVWSVDAKRWRMADGGWRMGRATADPPISSNDPALNPPSTIPHPPSPIRHSAFLSLATAAILLQVCFVYWFSYALKAGPIWHEGRALYYALNCDMYATPAGLWLRGQTALLKPLTLTVLYAELTMPFLAFCPVFTGRVRTAVVFAFLLMHAGFRFFMFIGIFPFSCAVAWTLFLPAWFWERPGIKRWLPDIGETEGARLREPPMKPARDYWKLSRRLAASLVVLAAFYFVLVWNMRQSNANPNDVQPPTTLQNIGQRFPLPDGLITAGQSVGIDQFWTMFAPSPPYDDGWFVVVGRLLNGHDVDLFRNGKDVTFDKPALVSAMFVNNRWQKYLENLTIERLKAQRLFYCRYLCRDWNQRHGEGEQVRRIMIYWMLEKTEEHGIAAPVRHLLRFHVCADETEPGTHAIESPGGGE